MGASAACILIVDDEEALLLLMSSYLARLGYQTVTFTNATAALQEFDADPQRFSLVIADLSLPDMQGDQMALHMLAQSSGTRVLLCSGYLFATESLPETVRHRVDVLQKPFLPRSLADAVRRLLGTDQS